MMRSFFPEDAVRPHPKSFLWDARRLLDKERKLRIGHGLIVHLHLSGICSRSHSKLFRCWIVEMYKPRGRSRDLRGREMAGGVDAFLLPGRRG